MPNTIVWRQITQRTDADHVRFQDDRSHFNTLRRQARSPVVLRGNDQDPRLLLLLIPQHKPAKFDPEILIATISRCLDLSGAAFISRSTACTFFRCHKDKGCFFQSSLPGA
jgi:hypothetical protein